MRDIMHIKIIEYYKPKNEQEVIDKKAMLDFARNNENALFRTNLIAHFTNSAIILNETMDKVLFVNHLIYKSWGWIGGHNDGNPNFLEVVLEEATEETGVKKIRTLLNEPVALDNILVHNHIKHNEYVGDHIHMNLTYLLIADENQPLITKPDENSGVQWFKLDDALNHITENRMITIYNKLFSFIKTLEIK